jgi:hypothetical protein
MSATFPTVIRLIFTVIGLLLHLIGLVTPDWLGSGTLNQGLWKYCLDHECEDTPSSIETGG